MIEKLVPVDLPPGFFHNGTKYESKGRWYDGHLVRWHQGVLQPVGGWSRLQGGGAGDMAALTGNATAIIAAQHSGALEYLVVGTSTGLWACRPQAATTAWTDITPVGWVSSNWQLDVFGDLIIAMSNQRLYTWDMDLGNLAVIATGAPTNITGGAVVTPERFVFVLGSNTDGPKTVVWPDQETTTDWTPLPTNQAGELPLQASSWLVCGRRVRDQTMIWSRSDLWSARYIGGQFVYSFRLEGEGCGIVGAKAVAVADGRAFWMGDKGFFQYDGWVRPLECDVYDKVFGEIASAEKSDVAAWANTAFDEIWWFYGTTALAANNRYVKYNYRTGVWDYGAIGRDVAISTVLQNSPLHLAVDGSGLVWQHENGNDRGSEVPYIESGPFEIEDGDRVMRIQRIVPDEKTLGDTNMSVYTSFDPTTAETENGPYTLAQPTDVRLTAKQIRVKITQAVETNWRVGKPRLGVIPMGRR